MDLIPISTQIWKSASQAQGFYALILPKQAWLASLFRAMWTLPILLLCSGLLTYKMGEDLSRSPLDSKASSLLWPIPPFRSPLLALPSFLVSMSFNLKSGDSSKPQSGSMTSSTTLSLIAQGSLFIMRLARLPPPLCLLLVVFRPLIRYKWRGLSQRVRCVWTRCTSSPTPFQTVLPFNFH